MAAVAAPADVPALLRSRRYLVLLIVSCILGVPIAAAAYWFLYLISELQKWLFQPSELPHWLGFHGVPLWWPLPMLFLSGLFTALAIRYLPGRGGHSPADGFHSGGGPSPAQLPGVLLAAVATLGFGAVLGPEAPTIALGSGLAICAVRLVKRDADLQAVAVVAAAGSFAAVSTLLGSPLVGAFLLMEASGLGGAALGLVLLPGLLAAGVGSLIFIGLDSWTGHGTFALAIPDLPPFARPDVAQFGWAVVIGLASAVVGVAIRRGARWLRPHVEPRMVLLMPVLGLAIGGLAIAFAQISGKQSSLVLFSGQSALPGLLENSAAFSAGTLVLLVVTKGLAYGLSLSSFRGGPTFPGMFIGAAGGIALSHLPGLPMVAGAAMGIGAMTCVMLDLPLTSVLLTTLFLGSDGVTVLPLVIVAVSVAYVAAARLAPLAPGPSAPDRARTGGA